MILQDAIRAADPIFDRLLPHCTRIEIAGSVRRRKPEVGDIEIVCIPRVTREADLFSMGAPKRDDGFADAVRALGIVRKGCPDVGKHIQIERGIGLQIDIFTATPRNWGLIFAIRTGSARYSHEVLARGWVRAGCHSAEGTMYRGTTAIDLPEETDLFNLIGVPYLAPEKRV